MARIQLAERDTREISRIDETAPSPGVLVQQLGVDEACAWSAAPAG